MSSDQSDDLAALFRAHRAELQASTYRRVGDRELAADIVQDAFLRYAAMDPMAREANSIEQPRFFLWRIVTNLIIDRERQAGRRGVHGSIDVFEDTLADAQPLPDRQFEASQRLTRLHAALEGLPPNCRDALLLNRLEGLSHQEIAQRLGVSPSMVSKYIMQALRHCARAVPPENDE